MRLLHPLQKCPIVPFAEAIAATHLAFGGPRSPNAGQTRSELSERVEARPTPAASVPAKFKALVEAIKGYFADSGLFQPGRARELIPEEFASHPSCLKIWEPHYREPSDLMLKSLLNDGSFHHLKLSRTPDSIRECKLLPNGAAKSKQPFVIDLDDLSEEVAASRLQAVLNSQHKKTALKQYVSLPSVFITNLSRACIDHQVAADMLTMMQDVEEDVAVRFGYGLNEVCWDDILKPGYEVDGFGKRGGQIYIKSGLCVTALHDEICWYYRFVVVFFCKYNPACCCDCCE